MKQQLEIVRDEVGHDNFTKKQGSVRRANIIFICPMSKDMSYETNGQKLTELELIISENQIPFYLPLIINR